MNCSLWVQDELQNKVTSRKMLSKLKLSFRLLGPIYYREIQRLADPSSSRSRHLWLYIFNLIFICQFFRCTILLLSTVFDDDRWYEYDILCAIHKQIMHFDPYMLLCFCSLFLFLATHNTIYYYASRQFIWHLIYELVGTNCGDIVRSNRTVLRSIGKQLSMQNLIHRPQSWWIAGKQCLCLLRNGESINGHRLRFTFQLKYFSMASNRTRVRTFAVVIYWEAVLTIMLLLSVASASIGVPTFYCVAITKVDISLFHTLITLMDLTFTFYLSWIGFKLGCFALYTQLITLFAINATYRELNAAAERRLLFVPASHCINYWALPHKLWHYRREHARLTGYILTTDDRFWSAGLCNFYLHNIPINVYLVTYLVYRQSDEIVKLFLLYILGVQLFAIAMSMLPAAKSSYLLHSSRHYMCSLQGKIPIRHLWLKLKYLAFQEQVTTNMSIGYHVGPFFAIRYQTVFELLYIYIGFYLYTIRLIK